MPNGQVTLNPEQAEQALDLGEVSRVTYNCISCSATMEVMVLEKVGKLSLPTFCDTCRMGISRGGHNTPVSLIGRYNSGKSFMDGFVDK